jgi:hypothetical protein
LSWLCPFILGGVSHDKTTTQQMTGFSTVLGDEDATAWEFVLLQSTALRSAGETLVRTVSLNLRFGGVLPSTVPSESDFRVQSRNWQQSRLVSRLASFKNNICCSSRRRCEMGQWSRPGSGAYSPEVHIDFNVI